VRERGLDHGLVGGAEQGAAVTVVEAGDRPDDSAVQSAKSGTPANERLCEAYFYLGEGYLADGDIRRAREYFQKSIDQGVTEFYEDGAARGELVANGDRR